jgi:hypothetical protein
MELEQVKVLDPVPLTIDIEPGTTQFPVLLSHQGDGPVRVEVSGPGYTHRLTIDPETPTVLGEVWR